METYFKVRKALEVRRRIALQVTREEDVFVRTKLLARGVDEPRLGAGAPRFRAWLRLRLCSVGSLIAREREHSKTWKTYTQTAQPWKRSQLLQPKAMCEGNP